MGVPMPTSSRQPQSVQSMVGGGGGVPSSGVPLVFFLPFSVLVAKPSRPQKNKYYCLYNNRLKTTTDKKMSVGHELSIPTLFFIID